VFVGLDGRSGAGKSTLAALVAKRLRISGSGHEVVTVIEGDQFYAGGR
jgi:uridine kinase